jgi:hypothetical protein
MSRSPVKYILATVALALFFSSAAEAAKKRTHRPPVATGQAARLSESAAHRPAAQPMVVFGDRVIGTDPDPRIRHELLRDLGAVFGGAD